MSETGTRLKWAEAARIACEIQGQIEGESHVVGSIRRNKPEVGDIEIMVHRNAVVRLDVSGPGLFVSGHPWISVKGGKSGWKYWQLQHRDGYVLDLYGFDDLNRGSIMLIRTGPADFSRGFVMCLHDEGLRHDGGYVRYLRAPSDRPGPRPAGTIVSCPDERTAFELAGMKWIEPEDRK